MRTRSGANRNQADARHEIASAACDLVAERGLDDVSLRRIAQHLGSTTGFISHYYVDKEDLLEAALLTALDELTVASAGVPSTLEEWFDTAIAGLPRDGESQRFWRVLTAFQAASLNSVRLTEMLRNYAPDRKAFLVRHLADVVPRESTESEIEDLAQSIFLLLSGIGTALVINPGAFSIEQQRAVVRAAAYGLIEEFAGRQRAN